MLAFIKYAIGYRTKTLIVYNAPFVLSSKETGSFQMALWDIDLADVSNLTKYNNGIHFLLVAIDAFSRFLWVVPLKDKKHDSIIDGLRDIFNKGRKPIWIRTDKGAEFKN